MAINDKDLNPLAVRLAAMDTATLHESGAGNIMNGKLRKLSGSRRLAGPAFTVLCPPGDNLTIHVGVAQAKPGDVLVVQCHDAGYGVWGEVLSVAVISRGIAGLIVDGSVRDLAAIQALDFPVFAQGTCLRGTGKDKRARAMYSDNLVKRGGEWFLQSRVFKIIHQT